jgi:hypothetical protein
MRWRISTVARTCSRRAEAKNVRDCVRLGVVGDSLPILRWGVTTTAFATDVDSITGVEPTASARTPTGWAIKRASAHDKTASACGAASPLREMSRPLRIRTFKKPERQHPPAFTPCQGRIIIATQPFPIALVPPPSAIFRPALKNNPVFSMKCAGLQRPIALDVLDVVD